MYIMRKKNINNASDAITRMLISRKAILLSSGIAFVRKKYSLLPNTRSASENIMISAKTIVYKNDHILSVK